MGSGKWVLENIGVAVDGLIELQSKDAILLVYGKKKLGLFTLSFW